MLPINRAGGGPIHEAFASLTAATTMDIVIGAGWPFRPPALFVDGLDTNHSTLGGFVCLWQDGDPSREWETGEGFFSRIEEWCENAEHGWEGDDLGYDAFLNFQRKLPNVATFDRSQLVLHRGGWGDLHGVVNRDPPRIDVGPGRASSPNHLRGLWFHAGRLSTPPPRQLSEVFRCLSRAQAKGLRRELDKRRGPQTVRTQRLDWTSSCSAGSGNGTTDLLVMACEGMNNEVEAIALQPGPTDESSLILRAGPDARGHCGPSGPLCSERAPLEGTLEPHLRKVGLAAWTSWTAMCSCPRTWSGTSLATTRWASPRCKRYITWLKSTRPGPQLQSFRKLR